MGSNKNFSAFEILFGSIFGGVGLLFFIIGLCMLGVDESNVEGSKTMLCATFIGMGGLFAAIGIVFVVRSIVSLVKGKRLKKDGVMIWADVDSVDVNFSVSINGRHPDYVVCSCRDQQGCYHRFTSGGSTKLPPILGQGCKIGVFVNPDDYEEYYVDLTKIWVPDNYQNNMSDAYFGNYPYDSGNSQAGGFTDNNNYPNDF